MGTADKRVIVTTFSPSEQGPISLEIAYRARRHHRLWQFLKCIICFYLYRVHEIRLPTAFLFSQLWSSLAASMLFSALTWLERCSTLAATLLQCTGVQCSFFPLLCTASYATSTRCCGTSIPCRPSPRHLEHRRGRSKSVGKR